MLSLLPLDLKKVPKEELHKQILRVGIIAELDAISLYEQLAAMAEDEVVRAVLLDIAREEKTHVGEFLALLHGVLNGAHPHAHHIASALDHRDVLLLAWTARLLGQEAHGLATAHERPDPGAHDEHDVVADVAPVHLKPLGHLPTGSWAELPYLLG